MYQLSVMRLLESSWFPFCLAYICINKGSAVAEGVPRFSQKETDEIFAGLELDSLPRLRGRAVRQFQKKNECGADRWRHDETF